MSNVNFEDMSIEDIEKLKQQANKHIETRKKNDVIQLRKQIRRLVKEKGLTLSDIFPNMPDEPNITTIEPKYRDPENETNTWTGRGRTPIWLRDKINQGASKENFLIED